MEFDPQRKNLALAPEVLTQVGELRNNYQADLTGTELFSEVLSSPSQPKLGKRFKVDERRLAKVPINLINVGIERSGQEGYGPGKRASRLRRQVSRRRAHGEVPLV